MTARRHLPRGKRALFSLLLLLACFALLVGGGGHLGLFAPARVAAAQRPARTLVGLRTDAGYRQLQPLFKEELADMDATEGVSTPAILLEGDFAAMPREFEHAMAGYVALDPVREFPAPLVSMSVPAREVVVARIRAHRRMAAFKTYRRIRQWLEENDRQAQGPVLELYLPDGVVELEVGLVPVTRDAAPE